MLKEDGVSVKNPAEGQWHINLSVCKCCGRQFGIFVDRNLIWLGCRGESVAEKCATKNCEHCDLYKINTDLGGLHAFYLAIVSKFAIDLTEVLPHVLLACSNRKDCFYLHSLLTDHCQVESHLDPTDECKYPYLVVEKNR